MLLLFHKMIIIEFELTFHLLLIKSQQSSCCTFSFFLDTLCVLLRQLNARHFTWFLSHSLTTDLWSLLWDVLLYYEFFCQTTEGLTLLHFLPFLWHSTFVLLLPGIKCSFLFFSFLQRVWNARNSTIILSIISDAVFDQLSDSFWD